MLTVILVFFLAFLVFLLRYNFFRPPRKGILVLLYHRVDDKPTGTDLDKFSIPLKTFERQVERLKKKGFLPAHPGNIDDIVKNKLYLKHRYVMFTFDDGYKDNLQAAEILKKYDYKGIFFISTAHIGGTLDGVEMMNFNDLKLLCDMGMYLGSHSHRHINLLRLSLDDAKSEISKSLDVLYKYQTIEDFAYPFGGHSDDIVDLIGSLGFKRAFIIGQKIYNPEIHSELKIPRAK